jgi:MFS family permease
VRPRFTGLWRHPDFVRLWAGETISIFGSLIGQLALQFTAIIWLGAGPLEISVLGACQLVPAFIVGLAAGAWVDRLRRRPIMIAADIGRGVVLATVPLAALFDVLTVWHLYAVALAASGLTMFFDVAYEAYLPTLVERNQLVEGNSKLAASASVAEVGAFGIAGWMVQLLSGPGAVLVDSLSFFASAFFVRRIRTDEPARPPSHERQALWREVREGANVLIHQRLVRSLTLVNVLLMFASRIVSVTLLLYLAGEVGFEPGTLGMIFAVGGVTSLAGAFFASRPHLFGGLGPALALSLFVRAAGALFMPLAADVSTTGVALLVANQLLTDPAWTFFEVNVVSLRQRLTPDRLLGRVNATIRFTEFGAMLLGTVVGGVLGQVIGLRETLFVAVAMMFAAGLVFVVSPVAALRTAPPPLSAESG